MTQLCGNCGRTDGQHEMWCKNNAELRPGHIIQLPEGKSPLDVQVAGSHYKGKKIQPVEYIHANGLNFLEGCIVKRITRWREKPAEHRFQDLEKIKHEVDLLIEMEKRHG
jgi:hypothetical protein